MAGIERALAANSYDAPAGLSLDADTLTNPLTVATTGAQVYDLSDYRRRYSELGIRMHARPEENVGQLFSFTAAGDRRSREKLVELYMPQATAIASLYNRRGGTEPLADIEQVAFLGLIKAIDRYKVSINDNFLPFAATTIRGEIKRYYRDNCWAVHVDRGTKELGLKARNLVRQHEAAGNEYTFKEIAEELGDLEKDVQQAYLAVLYGSRASASLDQPVGNDAGATNEGDDVNLRDIISDGTDEDSIFEKVLLYAGIDKVLRIKKISLRDKAIFIRHVLMGYTQTEVAADFGISQMQVSRIAAKIIDKFTLSYQVET